MKYKGR